MPKSDDERITELNLLMKMFGIDGKVTHFPQNHLAFHLRGKFDGVHQGMARGSLSDIEDFVQGFVNGRPEPNLGDALRAGIQRDK